MKLIDSPATNTYSLILQEDEWYLATAQQKEAWINQIQREGVGRGNLNILVDPDKLMSIAPYDHMHNVWLKIVRKGVDEKDFTEGLWTLFDKYHALGDARLRIMRTEFGL